MLRANLPTTTGHQLGLGLTRARRAQVWDFLTGKLKRDLQFQADEQFMMHDTAVLALAFSRDSELLASASQDGKIKVHVPAVALKPTEGRLTTATGWCAAHP